MRLQAIAISLLASTGLATPVRRDVGRAVYTLRLISAVKSLNGLYLTTTTPNETSTTLGVYTNADPSQNTPTIKFYPVSNPSTGLSELRTQDTGSTLAVVGANGLLDFASLADPADVGGLPEGTVVDWTSFELDGQGRVQYLAGNDNDDEGARTKGSWVAFPAVSAFSEAQGQGWVVKWKDANAWVTANYMPVQVVYELVKDE